jgi:sarcosine oxidase subunit gamma
MTAPSYAIATDGPARRAVFALRGPRDRLQAWLTALPLPPLPDRPNTRSRSEGLDLLWTGPDRWLLLAPLEAEDGLEAALRPDETPADISIALVSDSVAFFTLTGRDAGVAMAIACPLDLHPSAFGPEAVSFTDTFGVRGLVMRAGEGWVIGVDTSHAAFVGEHLHRLR